VQVHGGRSQDISGELLRGLRAGSSHAWARLYDQLAPGIHRFAASCLSGNVEAAEDIVVETLAVAARDITRFDAQKSPLSAWIYGIARHRVQAELRWCRRRKSVPAWAQVSFEDLSELADSHDLGARTAARLVVRA
jgi:DNA-directed RNA polymerase specialized sigma24 family protein